MKFAFQLLLVAVAWMMIPQVARGAGVTGQLTGTTRDVLREPNDQDSVELTGSAGPQPQAAAGTIVHAGPAKLLAGGAAHLHTRVPLSGAPTVAAHAGDTGDLRTVLANQRLIAAAGGVPGMGKVLNASTFSGADWGAKVQACHDALPDAGGECDASALEGAQAVSTTVTLTKPMTLRIGNATINTGNLNPGIRISGDSVRLVGQGRGVSVIKTSMLNVTAVRIGANTVRPGPDNVEITGLTVEGPNPASFDVSGTIGLAANDARHLSVHDSEFKGWAHCAIGLNESCQAGACEATNHAIIERNWVHDNPGEGITQYSVTHTDWLRLGNLIIGNQIDHNGLSGVDLSGEENIVMGNTVSDNGSQNRNGDASGLQVTGSHANHNAIIGNHINRANQYGITVSGSYNRIQGNEIMGTTGAIGANWGHGLQVGHGGNGWTADGNIIEGNIIANNAGDGILVDGGGGGSTDSNKFSGNIVVGSGKDGIHDYGSTNSNYSDNTVVGSAGGDFAVGVPSRVEVTGGLHLLAAVARPACDAATRGTFWFIRHGAGTKDDVAVCAKDAADGYAWRAIY